MRVQAQDIAANFFIKTGAGLLSQAFQFQQFGQDRRRAVHAAERVFDFPAACSAHGAEAVLQRLDDMRHGVQAHHIGGAKGARAGTAELLAGQVIDHVVSQAKGFGLFDDGQHARNADAVGNEVGRVVRTDHALAQRAGDKGFQVVKNLRFRGRRVNQFHQRHVARRVKEVDAAKTRLDGLGQRFAEFGDRQAGGVAGNNRAFGNKGRDLVVQIGLPVHALGDRLDDEVTLPEPLHILFIVGLLDQHRIFRHAERRGLELFQALNRPDDDAVFRKFSRRRGPAPIDIFCRKVEQHHLHLEVDKMRGDLRTHDASAEDGNFFNGKTRHVVLHGGDGSAAGCS